MIPTIEDYIGLAAPGAAVGALLYAATYPLRRNRMQVKHLYSPPQREWAVLLFLMFCGAMAMMTLTPPFFDPFALLRGAYHEPFFRPAKYNFTPFYTFQFGAQLIAGNILLFMPFTFCACLLWRNPRWYRAPAVAVGVTVGIEFLQQFVGRMTDVDDLLLNAVGGLLGWLLWLVLRRPALYCEEQ